MGRAPPEGAVIINPPITTIAVTRSDPAHGHFPCLYLLAAPPCPCNQVSSVLKVSEETGVPRTRLAASGAASKTKRKGWAQAAHASDPGGPQAPAGKRGHPPNQKGHLGWVTPGLRGFRPSEGERRGWQVTGESWGQQMLPSPCPHLEVTAPCSRLEGEGEALSNAYCVPSGPVHLQEAAGSWVLRFRRQSALGQREASPASQGLLSNVGNTTPPQVLLEPSF